MRIKKVYILVAIVVMLLGIGTFGYIASRKSTVSNTKNLLPGASHAQTPDEEFILKPFPSNATEADKKKYGEIIQRIAKNTQEVNITDCVANPVVARVKKDTTVTFRNRGKKTISMTVANAKQREDFSINPGGFRAFTPIYNKDSVTYSYQCVEIKHPIGILLVTE